MLCLDLEQEKLGLIKPILLICPITPPTFLGTMLHCLDWSIIYDILLFTSRLELIFMEALNTFAVWLKAKAYQRSQQPLSVGQEAVEAHQIQTKARTLI